MSGRNAEQRLRRLEAVEQTDQLFGLAQRLAEESGRDVEEVAIELQEVLGRVRQFGVAAEVRRLAREFGTSEEDVRAQLEEISEELRTSSHRPKRTLL